MAGKRRRFGYVRKLPSGRYQASFITPSGARQAAPNTFRTKTDADRWLSKVEADLARGSWLNEELGREVFGNYARAWLRDHPKMGHATGKRACGICGCTSRRWSTSRCLR
jgi:hypothetical protein